MTLIKRKPWTQFFADPYFNQFENLPSFFGRDDSELFPAMNLIENKKDFKIELGAPGYAKDDFKIDIENGMITISAERKKEKEQSDDNYKRREFSYNSFTRTFNIPDYIDDKSVDASYKNGVLKIVLEKIETGSGERKRHIDVK